MKLLYHIWMEARLRAKMESSESICLNQHAVQSVNAIQQFFDMISIKFPPCLPLWWMLIASDQSKAVLQPGSFCCFLLRQSKMWVNIPVNKCSSGGTMASKIKVLSGRSSNGSLSQLKNSLEDNFFPVFWRWVSAAALYLAAHSFIDPIVLSSEDEILDKSLKSFLAKLQNGHRCLIQVQGRHKH